MLVIRKGRGAESFVQQKMFWMNQATDCRVIFNSEPCVKWEPDLEWIWVFFLTFLTGREEILLRLWLIYSRKIFSKDSFQKRITPVVIPMQKLNIAALQLSFSLCWVSDADAKDMTAAKISVAANAWSCKVTLLNHPQWWCVEWTLNPLVWWFIK